jgi:hypothetical protein
VSSIFFDFLIFGYVGLLLSESLECRMILVGDELIELSLNPVIQEGAFSELGTVLMLKKNLVSGLNG